MNYQATVISPWVKLGILCTDELLLGIEFLPGHTRELIPQTAFAKDVCAQLKAYLADADFQFDLPLKLDGTSHQLKVWQAMCAIPRGQTRSYGELAMQISSSARAVGQACGNNPIPIIVPCHRVVGKGGLGGFMHRDDAAALGIKRWLLAHEGNNSLSLAPAGGRPWL
jgi:methylated-DNA-[protein]-cysteine S-methyltransferase